MSDHEPLRATYRGNCHCGAIKFSVKLLPIVKATQCNCSICRRKGYLFAFLEEKSDFNVESEDGVLTSYTFGENVVEHKFCPKCGTGVLAEHDKGPVGINIRTFEHGLVDVDALEIETLNGIPIGKPYQPFEPPRTDENRDGGLKLYSGSCHCQAVKYTVTCPPFEQVRTCNCSFCSRNANMWLYPSIASVDLCGTESSLTDYSFGPKNARHGFCERCGIDVVNRIDMPSDAKIDMRPINVRTMDGVDLDTLKIEKSDGWGRVEPPYAPYEV